MSQITTVFTHRNVNIESLTASESAIEGVHKYTIMVKNDEEKVANLVKQIEKKIDVLKVFCYSPSEVVLQQLALYKVQRSRNVEDLVRRHNVRILDIHDDFIVWNEVEKWRDFGGIRNEENYTITAQGPKRLGTKVKPKTVAEVESIICK